MAGLSRLPCVYGDATTLEQQNIERARLEQAAFHVYQS